MGVAVVGAGDAAVGVLVGGVVALAALGAASCWKRKVAEFRTDVISRMFLFAKGLKEDESV